MVKGAMSEAGKTGKAVMDYQSAVPRGVARFLSGQETSHQAVKSTTKEMSMEVASVLPQAAAIGASMLVGPEGGIATKAAIVGASSSGGELLKHMINRINGSEEAKSWAEVATDALATGIVNGALEGGMRLVSKGGQFLGQSKNLALEKSLRAANEKYGLTLNESDLSQSIVGKVANKMSEGIVMGKWLGTTADRVDRLNAAFAKAAQDVIGTAKTMAKQPAGAAGATTKDLVEKGVGVVNQEAMTAMDSITGGRRIVSNYPLSKQAALIDAARSELTSQTKNMNAPASDYVKLMSDVKTLSGPAEGPASAQPMGEAGRTFQQADLLMSNLRKLASSGSPEAKDAAEKLIPTLQKEMDRAGVEIAKTSGQAASVYQTYQDFNSGSARSRLWQNQIQANPGKVISEMDGNADLAREVMGTFNRKTQVPELKAFQNNVLQHVVSGDIGELSTRLATNKTVMNVVADTNPEMRMKISNLQELAAAGEKVFGTPVKDEAGKSTARVVGDFGSEIIKKYWTIGLAKAVGTALHLPTAVSGFVMDAAVVKILENPVANKYLIKSVEGLTKNNLPIHALNMARAVDIAFQKSPFTDQELKILREQGQPPPGPAPQPLAQPPGPMPTPTPGPS
jgi:hypothetical protein